MADNKELLKLITIRERLLFTFYPWVSGLLWTIFVGRSFFYMLHLTGSALSLFEHSPAIDALITFSLALPPIALFLIKELVLFKKSYGEHTLKEIWEAYTKATEHPEPPEVNDRWGKKQNDLWVFVGGVIYVVLVIVFSIYGLK